MHVDEARFGSSRVFFLHRPVVSLPADTYSGERERQKDIDGCNEITDDFVPRGSNNFAFVQVSVLVCYEYGHGITLECWIDLSVNVNLCQAEEELGFF